VHLLDASEFLLTNDTWREGDVQLNESNARVNAGFTPLLASGIVLTQGFIGGTADRQKTTLGREGSDYTAALLAYFLDADSVTIWKDVPGVLSADPKWMPDAVLLPELSYQEAAELTYYGATVIHPKTIRPLAWKKIPLYVRSFLQPAAAGTLVGPDAKKHLQEAYIRKTAQVLVSMSSRDFSFMDEKSISELLQSFASSGLSMQMLQVSATSISLVTDDNEAKLEKAFQAISSKYSVKTNRNLTLITIQHPGEQASAFRLDGKEAILVQKTRSSLQLLFQE
jgi:aspartate kinase